MSKPHKPVQWVPRERETRNISFSVDAEFYDKMKQYCKENNIKISQLGRFAVSRMVNIGVF